MFSDRSIPHATAIPVLAYPDVNQAAAWLCDAFAFSVRMLLPAWTCNGSPDPKHNLLRSAESSGYPVRGLATHMGRGQDDEFFGLSGTQ
jgi:hypothetical protein